MPLFTDSDLAAFVDVDTFGESVTFTHNDVDTTIEVVFTNNYVEISGGAVDIEGTYPVANCRSSDITGVIHGDTLTVGSQGYNVIGIQPDITTGMTKLILNET